MISTSPATVPVHRTLSPSAAAVPGQPPTLRRAVWADLGSRLGAALWLGLAVVDVARGAGPATVTGCLMVLVLVCSRRLSPSGAVAVGLVAWCLVTGFVVDGTGALRMPETGDLVRLAVLAGVAVATATLTRSTRWARR